MRFSKIKDNDIANGEGIVMSLWTQGCPHHCKGCFNMETWDFDGGKEFTEEDKYYILQNIDKNNIKRNLSILGGEPLCPENVQGVIKLCKDFKEIYPEKLIYVWT
ncbi:MAG: 4Fe-4S cluster-binding domain-containing protein, partial [Peptostreptococcaceae bacterium]